jgi:signal transduction histidine kinase
MPGPLVLGKDRRLPWRKHSREPWQRVAFAFLCVAAATGLRWSLNPLLGGAIPWMFFFPAVVVAAWYGRLGGGLLTTALALVIVSWLWLTPRLSFSGEGLQSWISVLGFGSSAIFISVLAELWHRAEVSELKAQADLERERAFLNSALASITDGFAVFDPDWRYVYLNDVAVTISRKPREELMGRKIWDVFPQLVGTEFETKLRASRRDKKPVQFEMFFPIIDAWLEFRAYPMNDGTALYGLDISGRKRTELELAHAQAQLAEHAAKLERTVAERTAKLQDTIAQLEHFSYTISHDLRAPLRAMESFSAFVAEDYADKLDATGQDYLKRVREAAQRMDRLIREVLIYSRTSQMELAPESVDLDRLTRDIVSQYSTLSAPHIEIQAPLGRVLGNPTMLTQVLSNLLQNAVKFVRPGEKPRIRVWSEVGGTRLRLFVRDQGIGIPEVAQSKIFGMFQRAHEGKYEGTGIGLAIVKRAVERMNGDIGFESRSGEGSTFWVELPAELATVQD